jgi:hypothetical protein
MCADVQRWENDPEAKCYPMCKGTQEESTAPEVNFSNVNAANVLDLLGLYNPEGPWGSLPVEEIPAVLQRCMAVLSRDSERAHLIENAHEEKGRRRVAVNDDGMPEIRTGCRVIHCGNTDADTVRRVTAVQTLLAWAHERGLGVSWG